MPPKANKKKRSILSESESSSAGDEEGVVWREPPTTSGYSTPYTQSPGKVSRVSEVSSAYIDYESPFDYGTSSIYDVTMDFGHLQTRSIPVTPGTGEEATDPTVSLGIICQLTEMVHNMEARLGYLEMVLVSGKPAAAVPGPRQRGFKHAHVDLECLALFAQSPSPSTVELTNLYKRLAHVFGNMELRSTLSLLRKWFRKKRDENGQRVFTACQEVLVPRIDSGRTVPELRQELETRGELFQLMKSTAGLEIADEEKASRFLFEKIESYLQRHYRS